MGAAGAPLADETEDVSIRNIADGADSAKPQEVREKAGDAVKSELLSKAFLDDSNVLVNFGSYLGKIGQHIALDIGETKDWVAKRLSGHASDDEEEAGEEDTEAASREAWVDVAHKKKKILILMSDTGEHASHART